VWTTGRLRIRSLIQHRHSCLAALQVITATLFQSPRTLKGKGSAVEEKVYAARKKRRLKSQQTRRLRARVSSFKRCNNCASEETLFQLNVSSVLTTFPERSGNNAEEVSVFRNHEAICNYTALLLSKGL